MPSVKSWATEPPYLILTWMEDLPLRARAYCFQMIQSRQNGST